MSRYRVTLVPQGTIPRNLELGVVMKPATAGVQGEAQCVRQWDGWGVTIDDTGYVGATPDMADNTPIVIPNVLTWDVSVTLIGTLCPGECIDWAAYVLVPGNTDFSQVVITQACESVQLDWASEDDLTPFGGILFAIYATVNGETFGFPQLLITGDVDCEKATVMPGWNGIQDGPFPPLHVTGGPISTFPAAGFAPFTLDFSPDLSDGDAHIAACNSPLSANLFFAGGDPGAYGDFTVATYASLSTGSIVFRINCTGANDYTGIVITVVPFYEATAIFISPTFDISAL